MISEPELDGGTGFDAPDVLTEAPAPAAAGPRRPWLWALGGAVLASAVWGGGLYTYERGKETGPDLAGYRPVEDLCKAGELKALAAVLGERSQDGTAPFLDEPALSESSCSATFGHPSGGHSVMLRYVLHKVTDPGPEFAARAQHSGMLQKVDGIGEEAFFDDLGEEGGTLRVLDGQAEIELQVQRQLAFDEEGNPIETPGSDLSGIDVPMTQDVLALMAVLRK